MTSRPTDLADERFVSLTTFRRNGAGVPTPVWVLGDGADLLVTTPADAGKVKRLRRDARVTLQACSRRGRVDPHSPVVEGEAELLTDPTQARRAAGMLRAKYGTEYRIFTAIEWLARRGHSAERLVIRVRPTTGHPAGDSGR